MSEPCKYCKMHQDENSVLLVGGRNKDAQIEKDHNGYWLTSKKGSEVAIKITYCPWCGRKLGEEDE